MSHAIKAAGVKATMIKEGVTNLLVQQSLVESAYVRALVMFHRRCFRNTNQAQEFNRWILGYWNESSPINGNLINAQVLALESRISHAMDNLGSIRRIDIEVVPSKEGDPDIDVTKISGYPELVNFLVEEATQKVPEFYNIFGDDK
jgi:hypothetical protein